jgi:hypothetical protein
MEEVLVVVGPAVVADPGLTEEVAAREFAALGVRGDVVRARDAAHVSALLGDGTVVPPGPSREVRDLIGRRGRPVTTSPTWRCPATISTSSPPAPPSGRPRP